jgi:hypothetical protein
VNAFQIRVQKTKHKGNGTPGSYRRKNGKPTILTSGFRISQSNPWPPARAPKESTKSIARAAKRLSPVNEVNNQHSDKLASNPSTPSNEIKAVEAETPRILAKNAIAYAGIN